ncbi:MAG: tetratricopeptide repeat protein [Planctomycetota bacterium]|nr:tetratricopeptide repeat protein [Planctomycetota bacterium]MCZ6735611.1 tetratricopeptide repeat protein [Planctomycetota bacterium]MCZ6812138.1 tetratricopeptide repeat protein [Planctomycetota bacterium]MCZ6852031.1 tetratricopeptide repeat protein [Planctomycetota bacterium]
MTQDVLDTIIGSREAAADPQAAQAHYQAALAAEANGQREAAIDELRQAMQRGDNPEHQFKLAYLLDLVGEEDEAVAVYEQLCARDQPHINALLNLSVVYEDRGQINEAEKCLRQILDTNPNHQRAREYMKDVQGSRNMFYDEEHARDLVKRNALLDTPVTDFELSVRARNCLKKMQIRSLGDLLRISEAELLSYKNFGETSLTEIRTMLAVKGLRLGQGLEGQYTWARKQIYDQLRGRAPEGLLGKSISVLELSVRARKALQHLGIQTLGDVATRTEAELMGVKNFGATSLTEITLKLTEYGLKLRTLE